MTNNGVALAEEMGRSLAATVRVTSMTGEMIPAVREIHCEAFDGYMNTRLGISYVEAFLGWFLTAEGAVALVALDGHNRVVGYVVGAAIDYGARMNRDLICAAVVGVLLRPWLLLSRTFWQIVTGRFRSYFGPFGSAEGGLQFAEPAMSLIAIGVARSARGRKVGVRLLRAFEDKARTLGARSLQLTVYSNNVIARRLYETSHWTPRQRQRGENSAIQYVRILDDAENHRASCMSC